MTDPETGKVARDVADRLAGTAAEDTGIPNLGSGDLGIALALRYAGEVFDDEHHRRAARAVLQRAAGATARAPLAAPGLYDGTAGFVWVLAEFARGEPRYLPALRSVTARLGEQVSAQPARDAGGVAFRDYDVISGAAGQLTALLRAGEVLGGESDPAVGLLLDRLLHITAVGGAPNWFCPPSRYPPAAPWYRDQFPHGMYNLGFAHGLPGVLAALCGAAARGFGGPALVERIHDLSRWLIESRIQDDAGPTWTGALQAVAGSGLPDHDAPAAPARTAWCYGAPGVATALLAGSAITGDSAPRDLAVAALNRVISTPETERQAFAPTLCHGRAGLLACYHRAGLATGSPGLRRMAADTLAQLCAQAAGEHPYVFADEPQVGQFAHAPGLLEGAAGVLLALLGAIAPEAARWDEVLFLSPNEVRDEP